MNCAVLGQGWHVGYNVRVWFLVYFTSCKTGVLHGVG